MQLLMSQVACRPKCVDRRAAAAAAVGNGRTLLAFFEARTATHGPNDPPVLMDSSSGGGATGDSDVVATGIVSKGEGGVGGGGFADVVAPGVVNGLEGCEGLGIDMDDVFYDAADGSGLADRTLVHAYIYCAELRPAVREPVHQHSPPTLHGIGVHGVSWEARTNLNRVYLHAVPTASLSILSLGCAGTEEQPRGTCAPCLDIKGMKAYRVSGPSAAPAHHSSFLTTLTTLR